ncbi:MAG TPA: hypothetical protein VMT68_19785 [Caulobacteraceae bacterium]|nr:hypothetical protein [Caulobacteraceae bacterium]
MGKYVPAIIAGVVAAIVMTFLMGFVFGGITPLIYGLGTGAFVAYIFANLAGNKKLPIASDQEKTAALELKPPPGKSLLVVYREGFVAKLAGLNVAVDGKGFAQLTAPKFTTLVLSPGTHTLTCGFGGLAGPQSKPGVYEFDVAADQVAGVGIGVSMGLVQGSMSFVPVADVGAVRAKVAKMPLVKAEPAEI